VCVVPLCVQASLTKVRSVPVETRVVPLSQLRVAPPRREEISSIEASMRLDAVASAGEDNCSLMAYANDGTRTPAPSPARWGLYGSNVLICTLNRSLCTTVLDGLLNGARLYGIACYLAVHGQQHSISAFAAVQVSACRGARWVT
jgi:hypothetical protein